MDGEGEDGGDGIVRRAGPSREEELSGGDRVEEGRDEME